MRPSRFDAEPNILNAEREYKHWMKTFRNYLECAMLEGDSPPLLDRKKYHSLINNVSINMFKLICDADNFNSAMQKLDEAFIKPTNIIYNRHLLITNLSIDFYIKGLEKLAQGCKFEAVDTKQNKEQYMKDAFINDISSAYIRQRLLENWELILAGFQQARALEQAQKQSTSYDSYSIATTEACSSNNHVAATTSKKPLNGPKCYFSSNQKHARYLCSAEVSKCNKCNVIGQEYAEGKSWPVLQV